MQKVDFHSHILPGMDDGAENTDMAVAMLKKLHSDGVDTVVLTPHFYRKDETISRFLERRAASYKRLCDAVSGMDDCPELLLGAEVYFYPSLSSDPDFSKLVSRKKLSWEQYDVLLRHLYESIRERKYFKDYMASGQSSLMEDAQLWAKIFEREFEDNEELIPILEELSIHWNDDLGFALSWCSRTMKSLGEGKVWNLLPLYQSELSGNESFESDKRFIFNLLRSAYSNFAAFTDRVAELTPKWNRDRICTTDLVLIVCGMAEAEANPLTPVRVIINEYVELSKCYSTPESSGFVNGLLDKLINKKNDNA